MGRGEGLVYGNWGQSTLNRGFRRMNKKTTLRGRPFERNGHMDMPGEGSIASAMVRNRGNPGYGMERKKIGGGRGGGPSC